MMILGSKGSAIVAWGMLPLLLLGAMPNASCICANGQRKHFCPMLWGAIQTEGASSCCGADCCAGKDSQRPSLEASLHSCCSQSRAKPQSANDRVVSRRCCSPELTVPAIKPRVELRAAPPRMTRALQPEVCERSGLPSFRRAGGEFYGDVGPPPDLVVTLERFLI